jgi:hypothetical protein
MENAPNFNFTLQQMEDRYRAGYVTDQELAEYLKRWNEGPHFTEAYWMDGRIRQRTKPDYYTSTRELLIDLKRRAAYNGLTYDFNAAGCLILGRAQKYLEHGTLLSPGLSTGGVR